MFLLILIEIIFCALFIKNELLGQGRTDHQTVILYEDIV